MHESAVTCGAWVVVVVVELVLLAEPFPPLTGPVGAAVVALPPVCEMVVAVLLFATVAPV